MAEEYKKFHFGFTCVAQKHRCLNFLSHHAYPLHVALIKDDEA